MFTKHNAKAAKAYKNVHSYRYYTYIAFWKQFYKFILKEMCVLRGNEEANTREINRKMQLILR